MKKLLFLLMLLSVVIACNSEDKKPLRYYGIPTNISGVDTTWPKIPDFSFVNQDSQLVTNQTFDNKVYVADFFFTHCPTICPKVKKQMLRIYKKYENDDRVALLSHTIDQKYDTVGRLKWFAGQLGVKAPEWQFVTGEKEKVYEMPKHYMSIAEVDSDAPGGYAHSGYVVLVDKNRYVRAYADGTKEEAVTKFMADIDKLLAEQFPASNH
jgi:protein SCO1